MCDDTHIFRANLGAVEDRRRERLGAGRKKQMTRRRSALSRVFHASAM
jgi:hypothetical protein